MFDTSWVPGLDAGGVCEAVNAAQDAVREQEWRELVLAAHWAALHDPDTTPTTTFTGDSRPGGERGRPVGGDGTPRITEFACAELGLVMGTGFIAAGNLIRDAVTLQHRHPRMWALLAAGGGRVWKARQVAHLASAADLTLAQARFVDAATTDYLDTLTWSAFTRLLETRIIEADPAAAEARRRAAALDRFVSTGQSNEHGLKTLIARAHAGEIIYLVAMCDRIAAILALEDHAHHHDTDPVAVRRSRALALLANPAAALALLEKHATTDPHPEDPNPHPDEPDPDHPTGPDDPADDPADDPDGSPAPVPVPANTCAKCGGPRIDPDRLRPRAVLYIRISEAALHTHTHTQTTGAGAWGPVAHCESGVGPLTLQAVTDLLGHHRVTIRPVLTLAGQAPIDAYEIPHDMREALRLTRPSSIFPWSRAGTSNPDIGPQVPQNVR